MPIIGSFAGIGVPPRVLTATALSQTTFRVVFSEPMGAGRTTPANYVLTAGIGATARTILSIIADSDSSVIMTVNGNLTTGNLNYTIQALLAVQDAAGNGMDPAHDNALLSGPGAHAVPAVASHCALAQNRMVAQFHNKTQLNQFVCTFGDRGTEIEQAIADVRAYRSINTAYAAQLDAIGSYLGVARNGLDDGTYRNRLIAMTMINASHGRPDELLGILIRLDNGFSLGDISLTEHFPFAAVMTCAVPSGQQLLGEAFAVLLKRAKPAAVQLILQFYQVGINAFSWSETVGANQTGPWDENAAPGGGGIWADGV